MKKFFALLAVLFISTSSNAAFSEWFQRLYSKPPVGYGAWECLSCTIPNPGATNSIDAIPDITIFIRAVNGEIHDGERVSRWIPNSTITVCNANNCLTVIYQSNGSWFPLGPVTVRGSRTVKVPMNISPVTGRRPITLSYEGPVPSPNARWTISIGPLISVPTPPVPPPPPVAATTTWTITVSPIAISGNPTEFSHESTDRLNSEIGSEPSEVIGPNEAGTYGGGGGGGGGCVIHLTY